MKTELLKVHKVNIQVKVQVHAYNSIVIFFIQAEIDYYML